MEVAALSVAVFGAACALINAIVGLRDLRRDYRLRRDGPAAPGKEPSLAWFFEAMTAISRNVNDVSSALGRTLPEELDYKLKEDIDALRPRIKSLLVVIEKAKMSPPQNQSSDGEKTQAEVHITPLESLAMELEEAIRKAIGDFKTRLKGKKDPIKQMIVSTSSAISGTKFCYGAVLCQSGRATAASLAAPYTGAWKKPEWGFICQYCSLEVGDYKSILLSNTGNALETSDFLASCHVMACDERELKAYYKCLVCYLHKKDVAFITASEFEAHMTQHPVLPQVLERPTSASSGEAQRDINKYLEAEGSTPAFINEPTIDRKTSNRPPLDTSSETWPFAKVDRRDDEIFISPAESPAESPTDSTLDSRYTNAQKLMSPWATPRPTPSFSHSPTLVSKSELDDTSNTPELDTALDHKAPESHSVIELPSDDLSNQAAQLQGAIEKDSDTVKVSRVSKFDHGQVFEMPGVALDPKASQDIGRSLGTAKRKPLPVVVSGSWPIQD
ncbi:hypothetical protein FGADI_12260 [Fusarium gaditjirri]|uniref:Uncharacterized protein n=1 Tax=Fusarium gaditjirri TaxID=282569 RepID=A0A8H4WP75_9HYPO|nr:hypothetical protein FGADI_12260 [Fusarium gaditjirri]